ncbi:SCO family protein [Frankia sp. AgB32]|uniref:SCO family protein n=1 Tax=Frankia sp. AgB32 TaxID=631119 RepID=UPI00200D6609|nr:SCO family protein [Frankia sp. AgB32]MCK9894616.1 SCO family protein [Frankia sp. AgB32]
MPGNATPRVPGRRPGSAAAGLAAAALLLLSAGCGGGPRPVLGGSGARAAGTPVAAPSLPGDWHGTATVGTVRRPSFTLTDTDGRRFDFAQATAGHATLLFFGYTHCPDVCPTTMADLAVARQVVGSAVAAKVTVVFVTTDPARDTPAVLARWLRQFDARFIGLTGTSAQVAAAQRAVGVPVALADPDGAGPDGAGYLVGHAAQVLGIGPDDRVHVRWFADTTVAEYVADVPRLAAAV